MPASAQQSLLALHVTMQAQGGASPGAQASAAAEALPPAMCALFAALCPCLHAGCRQPAQPCQPGRTHPQIAPLRPLLQPKRVGALLEAPRCLKVSCARGLVLGTGTCAPVSLHECGRHHTHPVK